MYVLVLELFKPGDERIDGFAKVWEFYKYIIVGTRPTVGKYGMGRFDLILS
jgi:hypothetical protein